jgi:D-glycero-D-manno-heptose 1,7-bisphosphate phosphatase
MTTERAVFLDRDGTVTEEVGHLHRVDQLRIVGRAVEAVRLLNEAEFKVFLTTNQSAIARGYLSEASLRQIHAALETMLAAGGARLDAVYYCPHHPTQGVGPYRQVCHCRKPKPGMLQQAAAEWGIDLRRSIVVGDKLSDLDAGAAVGCRGVLVRTGYGRQWEESLATRQDKPDHIADDLFDAARWIVNHQVSDETDREHVCRSC